MKREQKKQSKKKRIIFWIIDLILIIAISVGGYFLITNLITRYQSYLAFTVTDEAGNIIKSSKDNILLENSTVRFNVSYVYPDKVKGRQDFKVKLMAERDDDLIYYIDNRPYGFNVDKLNGKSINDWFKLTVYDGYFEMTIPNLEELFANTTEEDGTPLYLGDIFSKDSFCLYISSFNEKHVIQYNFHFFSIGIDSDEIICSIDDVIIFDTNLVCVDYIELGDDIEIIGESEVEQIIIKNGDLILFNPDSVFVDYIELGEDIEIT